MHESTNPSYLLDSRVDYCPFSHIRTNDPLVAFGHPTFTSATVAEAYLYATQKGLNFVGMAVINFKFVYPDCYTEALNVDIIGAQKSSL